MATLHDLHSRLIFVARVSVLDPDRFSLWISTEVLEARNRGIQINARSRQGLCVGELLTADEVDEYIVEYKRQLGFPETTKAEPRCEMITTKHARSFDAGQDLT